MHITNIGGSLTTAVCLSLIAWSIRVLRAQKLAELKSRENSSSGRGRGDGSLPSIRGGRRAYARLSPTAFWLLVESRSIQPVLVDVRELTEETVENENGTDENGNEFEISQRLEMARVPVEELHYALRHRDQVWAEKTGFPPPQKRHTIVFVSTHGHSASQAAALATQLGFQRCAVIEGGLAAAAPLAPPDSKVNTPTGNSENDGYFESKNVQRGSNGTENTNRNGDSNASAPSQNGLPELETISRDALALLGEYGQAQGVSLVTVIDVRRYDERALYGSIRGSTHVPVEHLPRALLLTNEDWLRAYHFRKPSVDEVVVVYSRRNERAAYAKQLFHDAGAYRVLVLQGGITNWRNFPGEEGTDVVAYDAYAEGEAPPTPYGQLDAAVPIDRQSAEQELMHKNVLLP